MHTVGLDLIRGLTYRLKKMTGNNWGNLNVPWILMTLRECWASLGAQLVKNLPAMRETRVRFLGCEDPLEKG